MKDCLVNGLRTRATNSNRIPKYRSSLLFTLLAVFFLSTAQAQFNYMITANLTVTITGYNGPGGSVVVPSTISGFPVTAIANYTFANNANLTDLGIPASVTNLGGYAFWQCTNLLAINLDVNNPYYSSINGVVTDKNQRTLIQCPYGKTGSYLIPDSITNIVEYAFYWCTRLSSVTIPSNVVTVGAWAFSGSGLTNVTIEDGPVEIGHDAFNACTSLAGATLPNSVINLGYQAFYRSGLLSISLPDSITAIANATFSQCSSLTNITIGNNVADIQSMAFYQCTSLSHVTIPNGVVSIDGSSFENCSNLISISLPNSLRSIGSSSFQSCTSLANVTIPDSVTNLADRAFYLCLGLTNVTIGSGLTDIQDYTFYQCRGLTSLAIPDNITAIGMGAFELCINLSTVYLGKNVASIGPSGFSNCYALAGIYFSGNSPPGDSSGSVFSIDNRVIIYYAPGTTGWSTVYDLRPALPWIPQIHTSDMSFGVKSNSFGFNVTWASGMSLVVEAATDVVTPVWVPLATITLKNCSGYFSDPQWANYSLRVYRVHSP
jgi:hypothetical protein